MFISKLQSVLNKLTNHHFHTLNLITIDSAKILANYDLIAKLNPHTQIWPVLKSNAYGHGYANIAKILKKRQFEYLVVDSYHEALEIWKASPRQNILLIGPILPHNFNLLNFKHLALTIQDLTSLKILVKLNRHIKIHLKINTGMNRQGLDFDDIPAYIKILKQNPHIILDGIFSHLADADNPNDNGNIPSPNNSSPCVQGEEVKSLRVKKSNSYTQKQFQLFQQALTLFTQAGFNPKFTHLNATAGSVKINHLSLNALRLGLGLYGYNPLSPSDPDFSKLKNLKPALALTSTITKIRFLKAGQAVSYNLTHTLQKDSYIGIIPLGYYDAIDRRLNNSGFIKYPISPLSQTSSAYLLATEKSLFCKEGKKSPDLQSSDSGRFNSTNSNFYPIIGRVCMNLTIVNFGKTKPKLFDQVEIISNNLQDKNSIASIARTCKTIPYDILVHLHSSIRRQII